MTDTPMLALAAFAGFALGALFFGGLWWTVRKGVSSDQPGVWFLGSLLVRMAMMVAGFLIVSRGHVGRLLACLFGFFIARILATRVTWPPRPGGHHLASEAADAS